MEKVKSPTIRINQELKEGKYSNFVRVAHTPFDFFMDFGIGVPEEVEINVFTRVIMSPSHAKAFLHALEDNVRKYETSFGVIPVSKEKQHSPYGEIV